MRVPGKIVLCRTVGDGSDDDPHRPEIGDEIAPDGKGLESWWVVAIKESAGIALVKVVTVVPMERTGYRDWLLDLASKAKYAVLGDHEQGFFQQPWSDVAAAQRAKVESVCDDQGWPHPPLDWEIGRVLKELASRLGTEIGDVYQDIG